jgi:hypothetical protein
MRNGSCSARKAEVTGRMLILSQRQQRPTLAENARATTDNPIATIRSARSGLTSPSPALPGADQALPSPPQPNRRIPASRTEAQVSVSGRVLAPHRLATASPRHHLLIRRHLRAGELAFHYCFVPAGQPLTLTRLIRAAGLRWPVEEEFRLGKDCFGLDESQVRLYTAIARHTVLVMAALAICALTAATLRNRTSSQPPPIRPDQPLPLACA